MSAELGDGGGEGSSAESSRAGFGARLTDRGNDSPFTPDADGPPLLAVDNLGAGVGQTVILTSDGRAVREIFGVENSPIRWAVLGIADT